MVTCRGRHADKPTCSTWMTWKPSAAAPASAYEQHGRRKPEGGKSGLSRCITPWPFTGFPHINRDSRTLMWPSAGHRSLPVVQVVPVARPIKTIKSHSPHKASGSSAHLRLAKKLGLGKSHARAQHAQQHRRPIQPSAAQRGLKVGAVPGSLHAASLTCVSVGVCESWGQISA